MAVPKSLGAIASKRWSVVDGVVEWLAAGALRSSVDGTPETPVGSVVDGAAEVPADTVSSTVSGAAGMFAASEVCVVLDGVTGTPSGTDAESPPAEDPVRHVLRVEGWVVHSEIDVHAVHVVAVHRVALRCCLGHGEQHEGVGLRSRHVAQGNAVAIRGIR